MSQRNPSMKILVLSTRGSDKASTQYRFTQYESLLRSRGAEVVHVTKTELNNDVVNSSSDYDTVLNLRFLMNVGTAKHIIANGRRTVFDFDDAIYTRPRKPYSAITRFKVHRRLHTWLANCDVVTTSSDYLAEYAREYAGDVRILPMALDLSVWQPKEKASTDKVTIGWSGSPSNIQQIENLDTVLCETLSKHPQVSLAVFSGKRPRLNCNFEYHPFQAGAETEFIQRLDIGLLPLVQTDFTMGKSPIKAVQYLACGIPVVGNVFGAGAEILSDSCCLKVDGKEDWIPVLSQLINDAELRHSLGQKARQRALDQHDLIKLGQQFFQILSD
jgi:glycosyltransferase involved in cell wall biosynthesis